MAIVCAIVATVCNVIVPVDMPVIRFLAVSATVLAPVAIQSLAFAAIAALRATACAVNSPFAAFETTVFAAVAIVEATTAAVSLAVRRMFFVLLAFHRFSAAVANAIFPVNIPITASLPFRVAVCTASAALAVFSCAAYSAA
ncbi:hypothetical protein SDC9_188218 [bioreactor metagenome]|uniref:Uncharacterized protein n=1 Tax=bioreactor metagenome TaxID=1076179 RepID=A0A645HPB0_9ZZZZ